MSYRKTHGDEDFRGGDLRDFRTRTSSWHILDQEPVWYEKKVPNYTRAMFRSESSHPPVGPRRLEGLGASAVPWQCWDQPGFKDCHAKCIAAAQKTVATPGGSGNVDVLIDSCMATKCIPECNRAMGAGPAASGSSAASLLASPVVLGIAALGIGLLVLSASKG